MGASAFRYDIAELERQFSGQRVTIVGNGPTGQNFRPTREDKFLWTINNGFLREHGSDLNFIMDDLKGPAWLAHMQREQWMEMVRTSTVPIVTSKQYEEFPATVEYPLQNVLQDCMRIGYFSETLSYMLAWATHIGVKDLSIHGCDYFEADRRNQRACAEFWMGVAVARGMDIEINPYSKLMVLPPLDYVNRHVQGFYGYIPENFPIPMKDGTVTPEGALISKAHSDERQVQQAAVEAGL